MAENETATETPPALPQMPPRDLSWMNVPTERPPKPVLGEEGFTLRLADAVGYGDAPDFWPHVNDTPRGSFPISDQGLPAPYTIFNKVEVWAESSADLYEAAIRDQWKPATEISWNSIEALPDHIEYSLDQIFSNISEQAYNSNQVLMGWLKHISYGYHEVKLYLATQVFDHARHVEAFRKRALSNGGGLGVQSPGLHNRAIYAAFKFTEFVVYNNIIRTSFLLELCEWGDRLGRSQADRQLFENMASDLRRHLQYGVEHVKQYALSSRARRAHIMTWLDRGETMFGADFQRDKPLREACILALGDTVVEGKARLKELRESQLKRYIQTLEACTIRGHEENIAAPLRASIDTP